jgi:hypothetical protein
LQVLTGFTYEGKSDWSPKMDKLCDKTIQLATKLVQSFTSMKAGYQDLVSLTRMHIFIQRVFESPLDEQDSVETLLKQDISLQQDQFSTSDILAQCTVWTESLIADIKQKRQMRVIKDVICICMKLLVIGNIAIYCKKNQEYRKDTEKTRLI